MEKGVDGSVRASNATGPSQIKLNHTIYDNEISTTKQAAVFPYAAMSYGWECKNPTRLCYFDNIKNI
jgi:hypothetical protein